MSNIDDIVKSAQGGQLVDNLSEHVGLAAWQTEAAVQALASALSAALTKAAQSPDGLRSLVAAIGEPAHKAAFESAESAHSPENAEAGEAIVTHVFGSAAAAGAVSQLAARDSGLRADVLARLLPVVASAVAGGLSSTLSERGLDAALARAAEPAPAPPPEPAPSPAAPASSGGLLGFIAALFGKRPAPVAAAPPEEPAPAAGDAEAVLAEIRQIFVTAVPIAGDRRADLEELLGRG